MTEPNTEIIRVKQGESGRTRAYSWDTPGRNDYKSQGFRFERVVDRDGVEYEPRWAKEPLELFPGCTTSVDGGYYYVHVSSDACPVRILQTEWYRYTGSDAAQSSSWETQTWLQFEVDA